MRKDIAHHFLSMAELIQHVRGLHRKGSGRSLWQEKELYVTKV